MLFRPLKLGDIAFVVALEQASFPPTEIKEIVRTTGKGVPADEGYRSSTAFKHALK